MKKTIPISLIHQAASVKGSAYYDACVSKGKLVGNVLELSVADYNEIKKTFSGEDNVVGVIEQPKVDSIAATQIVNPNAARQARRALHNSA